MSRKRKNIIINEKNAFITLTHPFYFHLETRLNEPIINKKKWNFSIRFSAQRYYWLNIFESILDWIHTSFCGCRMMLRVSLKNKIKTYIFQYKIASWKNSLGFRSIPILMKIDKTYISNKQKQKLPHLNLSFNLYFAFYRAKTQVQKYAVKKNVKINEKNAYIMLVHPFYFI